VRGIARARVSAVQGWKENGSFLVRASAATKLLQIVLAFIAHTEYRRKIRAGKQRTHNRRSAILDPCSYVRVHANRLPTHRIPATRRTNPSVSLFAMWQVSVSPCQSRISTANRGEHGIRETQCSCPIAHGRDGAHRAVPRHKACQAQLGARACPARASWPSFSPS
jgi:hypothetical protein